MRHEILFNTPATEEQLKGYCDLDLTNDEWTMAHVVAKKIPHNEFQNVIKKNPKLSIGDVLADCYDSIIEGLNGTYYNPNEE
tara:strand:- start:87 stop:332 length:246 start_codon:yes stop_codon:yes gene_type:complete